jgi:hypothetical protein
MKNKIILTTILMSLCSCTIVDEQAKEDLQVCTGAAIVSTSIRSDSTKLAAYQKVSDILGSLLKSDGVNREELKATLESQLGTGSIMKLVIDNVLSVYDKNSIAIEDNIELLANIESTKAAIDSGIQLAINTGRPVSIVPKQ